MRSSISQLKLLIRFSLIVVTLVIASSCGLIGPKDETAEAAKLVQEANKDLTKIKELYNENEGDDEKEGKRSLLKKALEANDAEQVKKISDDVNYIIVDGMNYARSAIEKIQQAQDM